MDWDVLLGYLIWAVIAIALRPLTYPLLDKYLGPVFDRVYDGLEARKRKKR
jgi:hypothetical protein